MVFNYLSQFITDYLYNEQITIIDKSCDAVFARHCERFLLTIFVIKNVSYIAFAESDVRAIAPKKNCLQLWLGFGLGLGLGLWLMQLS